MGRNTMKRFGSAVKVSLTIVMILCVAVFTILSDMIEPTINVDVYTSGYWLEVLSINGAAVAVIFLMKSVRVDSGKRKNEKYRILDGTLDVALRKITKNGATNDFLTYMEEDNKNAKRLAYETQLFNKKGKIIEQIQKEKARFNNKRLLKGLAVIPEPNTKKLIFNKKGKIIEQIQKEKARFNNKRLLKGLAVIPEPNTKKLIKLKSKLAFVEERMKKMDEELPFIEVRYIKQTLKSIFGHGADITRSERDTSPHEGLFNLMIFVKKALLLLAVGSFALLSAKQITYEMSIMFFFTIALRIFQIVLAIYSGISAGEEFVTVNLCDAFMQRVVYLQGYFDKAKGVVKPVTIHEVNLEDITKQVTDEVTEELKGVAQAEV